MDTADEEWEYEYDDGDIQVGHTDTQTWKYQEVLTVSAVLPNTGLPTRATCRTCETCWQRYHKEHQCNPEAVHRQV